eukprot:m.171570 g.171570  ORF g.171570 m.171570 type:complete len:270 (+) comp14817_c0_seq4:126-935(+)
MSDLRQAYDAILLGLVTSLEKRAGVGEIKLLQKSAASSAQISRWEAKFGVKLPTDLIDFLHITDGMHLVWDARMATGEIAPLGSLHLHGLSDMRTVDCPAGPDDISAETENPKSPRDGHQGDVVELDKCGGDGMIGLVYPSPGSEATPPSVWFADRAGTWHYVARSFTDYIKLMTIHLGIPGWQYAFTTTGLSPISQQWFVVYAPLRLEMILTQRDAFLDDWHSTMVGHPPTVKIEVNKLLAEAQNERESRKTADEKAATEVKASMVQA